MGAYGIITNTIVPLRPEPRDEAEITTQLLFGETFEILDKRNQWRFIKNDFDGYEGWIDEKVFEKISASTRKKIALEIPVYVLDTIAPIDFPDGSRQVLVKGCRLPFYDADNKTFLVGDKKFRIEAQVITGRHDLFKVLEIAWSYRNAPYLWGGMTDFGMDCSGLTQMSYKLAGYYNLNRNARDQVLQGELVDFDDRQPGDLAFFANSKGKVTHVGMVWFEGKILHAHGQVRVDELHRDGIFNPERNKLTHHLVAIKRYRPSN